MLKKGLIAKIKRLEQACGRLANEAARDRQKVREFDAVEKSYKSEIERLIGTIEGEHTVHTRLQGHLDGHEDAFMVLTREIVKGLKT
jgi:hypothetical protein